jgi:alkyl hydroperoxide reductase subunit AhpC
MGDGSAWVAFHPIEFTATTMTSLQQLQKRLRQFYRRTEMYCVIFSKLNWSTLLGV